jgi:hypothetical protein
MQRPKWSQVALFVPLATVVGFGAAPPAADRVSGLISRTYVIVEDTDLVGDVTCDVTGGPCFSFGASGVRLRLNGFSITGKADPATACGGAITAAENGVFTNGQNNVVVSGPGVVQRFRQHGIAVTGSRDVQVENIVSSTNCAAGVFVAATSFGTIVEGNVAIRNGATAPGASCGGV